MTGPIHHPLNLNALHHLWIHPTKWRTKTLKNVLLNDRNLATVQQIIIFNGIWRIELKNHFTKRHKVSLYTDLDNYGMLWKPKKDCID